MKIVGFEKLSLVDYDGYTACTLFTGGCNFLCPFCHNGTLVTEAGELAAFSQEDIFEYLRRRLGILEGVVITGGEPTLHKDLPDLIAKIKALGYKVKLDSNGTNPQMLRTLIEGGLIDYVAMDIKSSPAGYPLATGVPFNEKVRESVLLLKENKVPYEFRTTLVEGLITKQDIEEIAKWIAGAKLYVLQKFVDREGCIQHGLQEVPKEVAESYAAIVSAAGVPTKIRNYD